MVITALVTNVVVTRHGRTFCHESVITGLKNAIYAVPLGVIQSRDLLSVVANEFCNQEGRIYNKMRMGQSSRFSLCIL